MKYTIVWAPNPVELAEVVNGYIGQGWQPTGGVSVLALNARDAEYYQALVRR